MLVSEVKVAVTAVVATIDTPVLLTNYKQIQKPVINYGYTHHNVETLDDEPLMWQCARVISAAPGMIDLSGVGGCEDGGLRYPNPMWQWKPELDVLLSLGTGFGIPSRKVFSKLYESVDVKFVLENVGLDVSLLDEDTCSICVILMVMTLVTVFDGGTSSYTFQVQLNIIISNVLCFESFSSLLKFGEQKYPAATVSFIDPFRLSCLG
ncbi:conserved hypothetical protein [Histoplasma capsulatum H143]|uniref:Uncharacterized protein n=1 Tax=Ajellomyces capsulatus (strain H143) TaxID=544712 RepID=C6H8W5_AJECH|nr:conserved hypothetical protein [Histoplasma capsulatum H143]